MPSTKILLVSKDRCACDLPWSGVESRRWQMDTAGSGWEALERVQAGPGPDLILLDLTPGSVHLPVPAFNPAPGQIAGTPVLAHQEDFCGWHGT